MAESLKKKFVSGTSWTTSEHIILTIIGLVQLSVTSRLLTPVDFGIYAIATFFAGLGKIAFSMGLSVALIQKKGDIKPYLDTSWAASILVAVVISSFIMLIIPFVCNNYYHNNDAIWPSVILMLNCIFITASNPALIYFQKEIQLKKIFYLNVLSKLFSFVLVLLCVYYMKSYWGLIIALLSESLFRLVYSYILRPYCPKFRINWTYFKELYAFSGWIQLKNLFSWLAGSIDTAIVGNILGTVSLGFYNRAQSVSIYAPSFVNQVVDTVAFPLYSQINDNHERVNKVMISIQNVMIFLMSIVAVVFICFSDKVIGLILGNQWLSMTNVFSVLALSYLFQALLLSFSPVLRSFGYSKQEFIFYLIKIILTIILLYPFVNKWGLIGAAWAIALSVVFAFPIMVYIIRRKTKLIFSDMYYSILIAVVCIVCTCSLLKITNVIYYNNWFWIVVFFVGLIILLVLEYLFYLFTKKGPGEVIFQLLNLK